MQGSSWRSWDLLGPTNIQHGLEKISQARMLAVLDALKAKRPKIIGHYDRKSPIFDGS